MGASCSHLPPLEAVKGPVDPERFLGDWWVVGCKPTPFESAPHNALERYEGRFDGKKTLTAIDVNFTYRKKAFDGKRSTIKQNLFPSASGDGAWKAQPILCGIPLMKMDYLILDLAPDYSYTVVGVPDRKYVWIMSRAMTMPAEQLAALKDDLVKKHHYDLEAFINVPNEQKP